MKTPFQPLTLLLMIFAGWVNRRQQRIIEYLLEENKILKDLHNGRRYRLNNDQGALARAEDLFHSRLGPQPFPIDLGLTEIDLRFPGRVPYPWTNACVKFRGEERCPGFVGKKEAQVLT